jgi:TPR repeat protein
LKEAARQKVTEAQFLLGQCYEKGLGTQQNHEEAIECYQEAAKQGNKNAIEILPLL